MAGDGFYYEAASLVDKVRGGKGRVKSLCFASQHKNKKALFAVVTEACKSRFDAHTFTSRSFLDYQILEDALKNAKFFEKDGKKIRPSLAVVLTHDLVQDRVPNCSARLVDPLLRNKTRIKAEYIKLNIHRPKREIPRPWRYVRINPLLISWEECTAKLEAAGFRYQADVSDPNLMMTSEKVFIKDSDVEGLLIFPAGTDLSKLPLYRNGAIILQDKASCMPVAVLDPPHGSVVLDACAAPGNKTTQLAAAVGKGGKVYAFERDCKRALVLESTLRKHACDSIVRAECMDFLRTKPEAYSDVEYALVDPSCSGSGMLDDFEMSKESTSDTLELAQRLKSLSNFQCMIVRHAMNFPSVKKVVYSTCSIHKEENEEVVKQILEAEGSRFRLVQNPLSSWSRRGLPEYEFSISLASLIIFSPVISNLGQDVIRADPTMDRMNGFFVACFERLDG